MRDSGTTIGAFCDVTFAINGRVAALMRSGEEATFHVEPGELVLRAAWSEGLCNMMVKQTQRETTLKSGETKLFRITVDTAGNLDVQRSD